MVNGERGGLRFLYRRDCQPPASVFRFPVSLLLFIPVIIFVLLAALPAAAGGLSSCSGGILISREIKPFIEMVEGVEKRLETDLCRVFFDTGGKPYSLDFQMSDLAATPWEFIIAAGPEALEYLAEAQVNIPVFYGMVLTPDRFAFQGSDVCGVSLNLFTPAVISRVGEILPGRKKWAVFFNPADNAIQPRIRRAMEQVDDLEPVWVAVDSESDIRRVLSDAVKQADLIFFIPDQTVISPALVRHIIKYGLARATPAIGYNRFFHQSGALLSLVVNYRRTGQKVAELVNQYRETGECRRVGPQTDLLYNRNVADLLKIAVREEMVKKWAP